VPGRGGDAVAIASNGAVAMNVPVDNGDWLAASVPFVYKDRQYTEIPLSGLKDVIGAQARDVNALGMVAGLMRTAGHDSKGFLYADGKLLDLDSLVDPALGLHFVDAVKVDDMGRVTALTDSGQRYVLSAVPEASSLAMTALGLLVMGLVRRRSSGRGQRLQ
jgi:probable HAF family extracellular repeat protein